MKNRKYPWGHFSRLLQNRKALVAPSPDPYPRAGGKKILGFSQATKPPARTPNPRFVITVGLFLVLMAAGCLLTGIYSARASMPRQQPTVAVPTVTSSPEGPSIRVNADQTFIYVHTGPGQNYPVIGLIVAGQKAPALAISPDQQWIQIIYLSTQGNIGWIYARVVSLSSITLPVVTPPPTPTQKVTPTLDPTLAARYPAGVPVTIEPTYTEPAPLILPTYSSGSGAFSSTRFPIGFVIIGLAVIGLFGIMLSILRSR